MCVQIIADKTGREDGPKDHQRNSISLQQLRNNSRLAGAKFSLALRISIMFNDVEESISRADTVH